MVFEQIVCHLLGDYFLQSSWMAREKVLRFLPALLHVTVYIIPFILFLSPSYIAIGVMWGTHLMIDRYRLARFVTYFSNFFSPPSAWPTWEDCSSTGYVSAAPVWLSTWLMIIVDNTMHLIINYFALKYL